MKRTKHSLSHYHLTTCDMGELVPISNYEVLPGDTIRHSTSALIRVTPLMTPVMHPVTVRIHHWFVPYRVLWPGPQGWEDFITGGPDGVFGGTYPLQGFTGLNGTLGSYFGYPASPGAGTDASAFPHRAYNSIYNEHYRDEDLIAEVAANSDVVQKIAWEKDYFTSARPWTQKGPAVTIPLGTSAPVVPVGTPQVGDVTRRPHFNTINAEALNWNLSIRGADANDPITGGAATTNQNIEWGSDNQTGLRVDLTGASASTVNQWRLAMALQRYQEARAQYGDRYPEYLAYLGVRSSDGRLDRPEYLGGGKTTISFSEVLRTGDGGTPSAANPIGDLNGHGIAAMRSRSFVKFFEEHGIVMTLASVRPRSMYVNGLHRSHSRRTKEAYWQKELELIGQQEVNVREVYAPSATGGAVFGYQDRYAEYRHLPSYVSGDFRDSTMNDWHFGRIFGAAPTLNQAFVECVPGKRPMAEQTRDSLWCMFNHSVQARRLVGPGGRMGRVL